MAALCAASAQAADECGPLSSTDSSQTVVCSSGTADDDYDAATEGNIFYQISDRDADYRFELKAGTRIVGKRDPAQVTEAVQTDDHGRRHNELSGLWANYGAFFVDTGNKYEGDITIRSEADIEAGNNDGVTIDQATIRARGIYALHRGKAGDINIHVAGGSIASTGAGIQATIDNFSSGDNTAPRDDMDQNVLKNSRNRFSNGDFRDHQFKGNINIDLSPGATIRTSGHAGSGVEAQHRGHGGIRLVAEGKAGSDEPDIETTGDDASGISVEMGSEWSPRITETGDIGVNLKNYFIRTTGDRGVLFASGLRVYNYMDGAIDVDVAGSKVHTKGARGIFAFHQGAGKIDIDVKDSEVETGSRTENPSEHGIIGQHQSIGLVAIKVDNSRVSTQADGSHGVYGRHLYRGDVMIAARGDNRISTQGRGSHGIYGRHQFASTLGDNRGNVDINVDGGEISTQGAESHGIYGHHEKEGSVAIRAKNADIRTAGAGARGIYALQMDKSKEIRIEVDGGSIAAGCAGENVEDPAECQGAQGTGITASFGDGDDTGPQGLARVDISRAVVRGDRAVEFKGGRGVLNLADSRLAGNVLFADGDDVLSITQRSGSGWLRGDIDFGDGDDALNLDIARGQHFAFHGNNIDGLETLTKKGGGWARFADDVHFSGSSLNLDDGYLVIAGHLNIGDGTLTVRNAGRLVFEAGLGGVLGDALGFGQISVGRLHFEGDGRPFVLVQLDEGLSKDQADQARKLLAQFGDRLNLIYSREVTQGSGGDKVSSLDLRSESDGTVSKVGTVAIDEGTGDGTLEEGAEDRIGQLKLPGTFVAGTGSSGASGSGAGGGGSGGGGGILGLGLLAVLLGTFLGGGEEADAGFAEYGLGLARPAQVAAADERGVLTLREAGGRPYRLWVRTGAGAQALPMAGVPGLGADGAEIGFSLRGGDGFQLSASVAPEAAARADSLRLSAEGSALALSGGWSDGRRFAGLRLSQGDFEAESALANPAAGGALLSRAGLRVRQAQLRAGLHLDSERLRWTPSVAFRTGSFRQGAHTAQGAALRAEVPAFEQDYDSLQLGLRLASRGWLDLAGGKWRPQLKLGAVRTSAGGARSAGLAQSDRLGVLSFTTRAGIRALPETVHSLSFGAQVKAGGGRAAWRFGLAGLEADGEKRYAALAGYRLRF